MADLGLTDKLVGDTSSILENKSEDLRNTPFTNIMVIVGIRILSIKTIKMKITLKKNP